MSRRKAAVAAEAQGHPPLRGEVWFVDLGEPLGHEQGYDRPFLVLSVEQFNEGGAGVIIGLPITSTDRGIPIHVEIVPPEAGLEQTSFVQPEAIRAISKQRLRRRMGHARTNTMSSVEDVVRVLLGL